MHTQSQTQAVTMMMEVQAMHTQAQTQAVTTGTRSVRELAPSPASTVKVDLHEVQQDATSPHACPTASDQPDLDASSEGTTHAYAISHPSASAFLSSLLEGTQPSEAAASPARSGLSPARSGLSPARTMLPCQFSACGRIKGSACFFTSDAIPFFLLYALPCMPQHSLSSQLATTYQVQIDMPVVFRPYLAHA